MSDETDITEQPEQPEQPELPEQPGQPEQPEQELAAESSGAPAARVDELEAEGDIAADYLEELLDIADLDGDLDMDVEGDRAAVSIVGADLTLTPGADLRLPIEPDFEYAILSMSGEAHVDGVPVLPGSMLYLGCGRTELPLRTDTHASLMLLGGEPFEEELIMFWNWIGRSQEEIVQARQDWMEGSAFGEVKGYDGDPLSAPELPPTPLKPRGRAR